MASVLLVPGKDMRIRTIGDAKPGAVKRRILVRKIENWFSVLKTHMGAKKKYKAHNSKYV